MPKTVRFLLLALLFVLLSLTTYLVYSYSVESGKVNSQSSKSTGGITKLTGRVLGSEDSGLASSAYCQDYFYLGPSFPATWLIASDVSGEDWARIFAKYKYAEVEVTGNKSNIYEPCQNPTPLNCGCDDYLIVDDIKVLKEGKEFAQSYEGEVYCASEGVDEEGSWCSYSLKGIDGKNYLLSPLPGAFDLGEFKGFRVRVLGIINKSSMDVFEITKI